MIFLVIFQWLAFAVFPVAAGWLVFSLVVTAFFRFRDTRVLVGAMVLVSTVFAATIACWGIVFLDLLLGFHGIFGIAQDIGLSIAAILTCAAVGFLGRGLTRSLSDIR